MWQPSKKRQDELRKDENAVRKIYEQACNRWTKPAVDAQLNKIWDMRCIMGVQNQLPFKATRSQNLKELMWVATEVCKLPTSSEQGEIQ